jgi:hypothetical protein
MSILEVPNRSWRERYIKTAKRAEGGGRFLTVGLKGQDFEVILWPGMPGRAKEEGGYIPGACVIGTDDLRKEFETPQLIEQPVAFVAILKDPDGNRLMLRETRQPSK